MKKSEQQQQAEKLFFNTNLTQEQIANFLNVDRRTVYNWMTDGNWRQIKKSVNHIPSKIVEQYYFMLASLNYEILGRGHQPYPLTAEANTIRTITLAIKNLKTRQTINESIEAYTLLTDNISQQDPELAERLKPYINDYITRRSKIKFSDCTPPGAVFDDKIEDTFKCDIDPGDEEAPVTPTNEPVAPSPVSAAANQLSPLSAAEASSAKEAEASSAKEAEASSAKEAEAFSAKEATELVTVDVPAEPNYENPIARQMLSDPYFAGYEGMLQKALHDPTIILASSIHPGGINPPTWQKPVETSSEPEALSAAVAIGQRRLSAAVASSAKAAHNCRVRISYPSPSTVEINVALPDHAIIVDPLQPNPVVPVRQSDLLPAPLPAAA